MEKITFDIKSGPLTSQTIQKKRIALEAEEGQLSQKFKNLKIKRMILGSLLFLLFSYCLGCFFWETRFFSQLIGIFAIVFGGCFFSDWVLEISFPRIKTEKLLRIVSLNISALDDVEVSQCPQIVKWCESSPAIMRYQNLVAHLDRPFVRGEYDMMCIWASQEQGRAAEMKVHDEHCQACESLRVPLV